MEHLDYGVFFSTKKKLSSKPQRDVEEPKWKLLSEETQFEKAKCCVIPTVWHSGRAKIMEAVKRSVDGSGLGRGRDKVAAHIKFLDPETAFYDAIIAMVDTCHYAFL